MPTRKPLDPDIKCLLHEMKAQVQPGHPFRSGIAAYAAYLAKHPNEVARVRHLATYLESMLLVGDAMKAIVAEKLAAPQLKSKGYLTVELEEDREIDAGAEQKPPYRIFISTSLYRYCAELSNLLVAGLGVEPVDVSGQPAAPSTPPLSQAQVAHQVKALLDQYVDEGTIPEYDGTLGQQHLALREIVFACTMACIVGHEFAHVVMREARRRNAPQAVKPYADFAGKLLRSNAQNLLYTPMHDPHDLIGFGKLDQGALKEIAMRWIDELTADLIGADLARTYHRDFGPMRNAPDIVAISNMSIHLAFVAQVFLDVYLKHRDPEFPLFSTTHPPYDFRLHCVVSWLYPDLEHLSVKRLIEYCQGILNTVIPPTGKQ